jgi:hypothetical protein
LRARPQPGNLKEFRFAVLSASSLRPLQGRMRMVFLARIYYRESVPLLAEHTLGQPPEFFFFHF